MSDAQKHREEAAQLPEGDLVGILLRQHADITEGLERVNAASGEERVRNFQSLKSFLKAHEMAEEAVVRPITSRTAADVAQARNDEEQHADQTLSELSALDPASSQFAAAFTAFMQAVADHAEHEEHEEFPELRTGCTDEERIQLGQDFMKVFTAEIG